MKSRKAEEVVSGIGTSGRGEDIRMHVVEI
jgi:hypothetical protein